MEYDKIYKKISKRYIIAGIILILLLITSQIIVQIQISHSKSSASIVNVSGRQRMLSQKITKNILKIYQDENDNKKEYIEDLEESLDLFKSSHTHLVERNKINALKIKNSDRIRSLFINIDPYFENIVDIGSRVLEIVRKDDYNPAVLEKEIERLDENEKIFLEKMDEIVDSYDYESNRKIKVIEKTEFILFTLIIFSIIFIAVFVFSPAGKTLRSAFQEVSENNDNIERLFKSMKGALFLVRKDGSILMTNSDAKKIINQKDENIKTINIKDNIKWIDFDIMEIINRVRFGEKVDGLEVEIKSVSGEKLTMVLSGLMGIYERDKAVLITAFDITAQKRAEGILKEMAVRDELTGLYNRHFLETVVDSEIERSRRYEYPLSGAILDLDNFKQINDKWGHPVGDIILRETANILRENVREADYLIRIGGEEFIILMPHTDLKGAYDAAEKFRKAIEDRTNPIVGNYTATFGVAQIDRSENYYKLYSRMDNALYRAKQSGKNCVLKSYIETDESTHIGLEWKKSWDSGEKIIDLEHRNIFSILSKFMHASVKNEGKEEIVKNLDRILHLLKEHFTYEERVLEKIEYENVKEHKQIHKQILEKAYRLKNNLIRDEINLRDVQEIMFHDIVVGHILKEDTNFFEDIARKSQEGDQ
nr:diguanylate cyclase [Tissierella sp.]